MSAKIVLLWTTMFTLLFGFTVSPSSAQNFPTYHQLGPAKATLWRPTSGTPHIAIVMMHRTASFLNCQPAVR